MDKDEDAVQDMADKADPCVVLCDVIDEKTVKSLGIRNFDVAIVAIGDLEPSLLCTMLMKKPG